MFRATYLVVCLTCFSCIGTTIESKRDENFRKNIQKVFVVINASDAASPFSKKLSEQLPGRFRISKVESQIYVLGALSLTNDEQEVSQQINNYEPDVVISFKQTEGVVGSQGDLYSAIFDIRMIDFPTQNIVWRAKMSVNRRQLLPMNNPAVVADFLETFFIKLHEDRIL